MSNVLIIGNVLKDVYLRLDERMNQFEKDENDVPWLDLAFDGRSGAKFFRRSSIYGGATVALEVVSRFGLNAHIAGAKIGFVDGEIIPNDQIAMGYRYVLCFGNKTSYLTANEREKTRWTYPKEAVDWIFIDRSTGVTDELVKGLQGFLSMSNHTRLAMYLPQNPTAGDKKLLELAELVFVDGDDSMLRETNYSGSVCQISDKTINFGEYFAKLAHGADRFNDAFNLLFDYCGERIFWARTGGISERRIADGKSKCGKFHDCGDAGFG